MARPIERRKATLNPKLPVRRYEVLTRTCAWGTQGEVIELTLTDPQEEALLRAGTVKRAEETPVVNPAPVSLVRPDKANLEGK